MAPIAALFSALAGWWIAKGIISAVVLFLPLAPTTTLFVRVLWIHLDQSADPGRPRWRVSSFHPRMTAG